MDWNFSFLPALLGGTLAPRYVAGDGRKCRSPGGTCRMHQGCTTGHIGLHQAPLGRVSAIQGACLKVNCAQWISRAG